MNTSTLARLLFRALALVPFVAAGCQAIAGIEERHYQVVSEGGAEAGPPVSQVCQDYCDHVMDACQGADAVYTTLSVCLGVCAKLPEGNPDESGRTNTVACRDAQAVAAGRGEPKAYCPYAGPGGGKECGPDCESYCKLYASTCAKDFPALDNCLSACATLRRSDQFSSLHDHEGDTLDCRLVHVSVATTDHETHCSHARIVPPTAPYCIDDSMMEPTCGNYCRATLGACGVGGGTDGGNLAVYESLQQCMDVCAALTRGFNNETVGNTVGCRLYHSYNALADPVVHCAHTGPTGDGHCAVAATANERGTDNCDPYCQIVTAACPAESKAHFGTNNNACYAECSKLKGVKADSGYTVDTPDGPTVQCRVLHAARAFQNHAECAAALGEETCN